MPNALSPTTANRAGIDKTAGTPLPAAVLLPIHIGCPVWAHAPWVGKFFTADARRGDFLPQYAQVFSTTEGNSTFYGLPKAATVERWADEAPADFRFAFKFPREISHDRALVGAEAATRAFIECLAPVADRCGPAYLQLHQSFGPDKLPVLDAYLASLPPGFAVAVEVRHAAFFESGAHERALDELLTIHGADRVNFDSTGLFAAKIAADDEISRDAARKKPRVPRRETALGKYPMVRYVGDPHVAANEDALRAWAAVLHRWQDEGREPYFFAHHPDDAHAPALARLLQTCLHDLDPPRHFPPPVWPIEARPPSAQLDLF